VIACGCNIAGSVVGGPPSVRCSKQRHPFDRDYDQVLSHLSYPLYPAVTMVAIVLVLHIAHGILVYFTILRSIVFIISRPSSLIVTMATSVIGLDLLL
jgi:hypothetical protein